MKSIKIFTILVTVFVAAAFNLRGLRNNTTSIQQQETEVYSRIFRGNPVLYSPMPYQVGLKTIYDVGKGTCGGSLISPESVLTATHCLINGRGVVVYLGGKKFYQAEIVLYREMHHTIMHSDYVRDIRKNDIALIRIPRVRVSNSIRPVVLPKRYNNLQSYVGAEATLAGWGLYDSNVNELSVELRVSTFSIMTNRQCGDFYGHDVVDNSKLCTNTTSGTSGCKGDSGGPLTIINPDKTVMQIGVYLSSGSPSCDYGNPNLFSRVDYYMTWIRDNAHF